MCVGMWAAGGEQPLFRMFHNYSSPRTNHSHRLQLYCPRCTPARALGAAAAIKGGGSGGGAAAGAQGGGAIDGGHRGDGRGGSLE